MFRGTLLCGHWQVSQGKEILTTLAVIQRGIVCEQTHKEQKKSAEIHNETL